MSVTAKIISELANENIVLPRDYLCGIAECLKTIAHPGRLEIILKLMEGEFTVDEISQFTGITQAQTCAHLRLMESKRLLRRERRGRCVYYFIAEPKLIDFMQCIKGRYIEQTS